MDTSYAFFEVLSDEAAIAQAGDLTGHILDGRPGAAVLTSTTRGIIWTYRRNVPVSPPIPRDRLDNND